MIHFKKGFVVMLLINIRPRDGYVNGTRYAVQNSTNNLLFLRAGFGRNEGSLLVLPRMNYLLGMEDFPIPGFRRCQFPVHACFEMAINKTQGQFVSGSFVLDLSWPFFSYRLLHVALSWTTHTKNLFVLLTDDYLKMSCTTKSF